MNLKHTNTYSTENTHLQGEESSGGQTACKHSQAMLLDPAAPLIGTQLTSVSA